MENDQNQLLHLVADLIEESRKLVVRNVNTTMIYTYFHIGRMIVDEEQHGQEKAAYAESVLKELSHYLTKEYGKGFSHRTLNTFASSISHIRIEFRNH